MLKHLDSTDLHQIMQSCPTGLAVSDEEKNIIWVNKTFETYLGISADEMTSQNINQLPEILKPLFSATDTVHIPANAIREDQWYMCSQQLLENSGNTAHYISDIGPLHLLIRQREALKTELLEALAVDEVTGMPNKVALYKSLESQISRSRRYNNLLSVVIMRVNHLEQLDETQTAKLLLPISQLLNDQVRWADIVGKLNASDFLLVLPETAAEACQNLADNLNERLNAITLPAGLPDSFNVSVSFGYAEWAKGEDLTLLMQKTRKMLEDK